ncbi:MAG TPA: helix-turn-helix domain-containing protein [Galbitalea sp.]|jgi:DNA-binding HxlR family transcriptional regulator
MRVSLEARLEDRAQWRIDQCPIAAAMDVIGTKSTILVLREALYGTTRFDDFVKRTGSAEAIVAARLKKLVGEGILAKQRYKEAGRRAQSEYVLTAKGLDLMPAVFALMQWGSTHLQNGEGPFVLRDEDSGMPVVIGAHGLDVEHEVEGVVVVASDRRPR